MNTTSPIETHDHLIERLNIERAELRREMYEGHYMRAASIADYICRQLHRHAEMLEKVKR